MKNLGKCYDSTSIMVQLLTSKSFQILYQPASLPLHYVHTLRYQIYCKINHENKEINESIYIPQSTRLYK